MSGGSRRGSGDAGSSGTGTTGGPARRSDPARRCDPARYAAFALLRAVDDGAYANLELPAILRRARLSGRDAAFATELARALLCESPLPDGGACGRCSACGWFEQGNHPDFRLLAPAAADELVVVGAAEDWLVGGAAEDGGAVVEPSAVAGVAEPATVSVSVTTTTLSCPADCTPRP